MAKEQSTSPAGSALINAAGTAKGSAPNQNAVKSGAEYRGGEADKDPDLKSEPKGPDLQVDKGSPSEAELQQEYADFLAWKKAKAASVTPAADHSQKFRPEENKNSPNPNPVNLKINGAINEGVDRLSDADLVKKYGRGYVHARNTKTNLETVFTAIAWDGLKQSKNMDGWAPVVKVPDEVKALQK